MKRIFDKITDPAFLMASVLVTLFLGLVLLACDAPKWAFVPFLFAAPFLFVFSMMHME